MVNFIWHFRIFSLSTSNRTHHYTDCNLSPEIEFGDFTTKSSKIEVVDGAPYTLKCRMSSKSAAAVFPVSILFDSTAKSKMLSKI